MVTPQKARFWFDKTRELTKQKKHRETYCEIQQQTNFLPPSSSLPQRLWHIINNTEQIPQCKTCGTSVSWDRRYKRYKTFCGNPKCVNTDPMILLEKKQKINYRAATEKRKQTNLERYGHTNFLASTAGLKALASKRSKIADMQNDPNHKEMIKCKRIRTMVEKYGVENVSLLSLSESTIQRLNDKDWLFENHYMKKRTLSDIARELNIKGGPTVVGHYLKKHGLITQNPIPRSTGEKEISHFLNTHNVQHVTNVRNIISDGELDIFIPTHNVAIEYCGLYWHSEQMGKTRLYHHKKWKACDKKGVHLLTIFEDEWIKKTSQVKNKILHMLGINTCPRVYARNTKIVKLDIDQKNNFFETHHLQGTGPGSITYGLSHNDEIVAAITFIQKSDGVYILNRYATSMHVVGGFSKLVKWFTENHRWEKIISFADLRWSDGKLYRNTGWRLDKILPPDYYYSLNGIDRYHKFSFRHRYLSKKLKNYDPRLSETVNCFNNNVLKVWDCGKLRFVLTRL